MLERIIPLIIYLQIVIFIYHSSALVAHFKKLIRFFEKTYFFFDHKFFKNFSKKFRVFLGPKNLECATSALE